MGVLVFSPLSYASRYVLSQQPLQVSPEIVVTQFSQCIDHVALLAHSMTDYHYLMGLYDEFLFDSEMRFLPVCLLPPTDIVIDSSRALTSVPQLATQLVKVQAQGNAYVSDAIMQLAHTDTYSVFIHELAHFAVFLDEYPMSLDAARFQCNIARQAPNVIHASQLEPNHAHPHPYADIFIAKLKSKMVNKDYKHIGCGDFEPEVVRFLLHPNDFTFLRFYDVPYIPYLYQYLWQQQIQSGRSSQIAR